MFWHIFNTKNFTLDDSNYNNKANISELINAVTSLFTNQYNYLADINLDQNIDVLDVVQIISLILN